MTCISYFVTFNQSTRSRRKNIHENPWQRHSERSYPRTHHLPSIDSPYTDADDAGASLPTSLQSTKTNFCLLELKKKRLQLELEIVEKQMLQLDPNQISSRPGRVVEQRKSVSASKRSSGESSTKDMSSSNDSKNLPHSCRILYKEITVVESDDASTLSEITLPLSIEEEIQQLFGGIGNVTPSSYPDSSKTGKGQSERRSRRSKTNRNNKVSVPTNPPSGLKKRHTMDEGEEQLSGRVKRMPWILTFVDDRPPISAFYSGSLTMGVPHGIGTFRFSETGDMYMGEIEKGKMHGIGMYRTCKNGVVRRGTFVDNEFQESTSLKQSTFRKKTLIEI